MRYGFTGTRTLRSHHLERVVEVLRGLGDGTEFITGAAIGIDSVVARWCVAHYPNAMHTLIVPAGKHDDDLVASWMPNERRRIERMPSGSSYADRNSRIVRRCDHLIGFPLHEEHRSVRSGTWQTIRMARRSGVPHSVHVLEPEDNSAIASALGVRPGRGRSRRAVLGDGSRD